MGMEKKVGSQFENKHEYFIKIIKNKIEKELWNFITLRRLIHKNPELGFREYSTSKLIKDELKVMGVEIIGEDIGKGIIDKEALGTGIVGIIRGKEGGKMVAIRADIDALPIPEQTSLEYASLNKGVSHSCGHDIHAVSLIGAASALKVLADQNKLNGDVLLLFQPNEERTDKLTTSGAIRMIHFLYKSGLREHIDAFFGLHISAITERGVVNLPNGLALSGVGSIELNLKAPGGHIMGTAQTPNIVKLLDEIGFRVSEKFGFLIPQEKKIQVSVESTIHRINMNQFGVLPTKGEKGWGFIINMPGGKKFKNKRKEIIQGIRDIIEKVVAPWISKGLEYDIKPMLGNRPVTMRDSGLVELGRQVGKDTVPNYQPVQMPVPAGEDFSYYLEHFNGKEIPGVFAQIGAANLKEGIPCMGHHRPDFLVDEGVIEDCSVYLAELARRFLAER